MTNPCGITKANVFEKAEINGFLVYFGAGVNPVNSPAQFFVAWGKQVLADGLIPTYNKDSQEEGHLWFVDEDEAETKFQEMVKRMAGGQT